MLLPCGFFADMQKKNEVSQNKKEGQKDAHNLKGRNRNRTNISGIRIRRANHYTIQPFPTSGGSGRYPGL